MAKRKTNQHHRQFPAGSDLGGGSFTTAEQTLPPAYDERRYALWFFEFLYTDLESLTVGQQLSMRADLLAFVRPELLRNADWASDGLPSQKALKECQAIATEGLRQVRQGQPAFHLARGITFGITRFGNRLLRWDRAGDFADWFRLAAMDTLQANWQQLRLCARCGRVFLKTGKHKYCSERCSRQAQWEKFKPKRPARDHRAEYERRTRARTGPRVKVQRRQTTAKKS
jgi:hypothetical protein